MDIRETESYLKRFHARYPGCSPRGFALGKSSRGLNSYEELLAELRGMGAHDSILDLACGDGFFLRLLASSGFPAEKLYGIDMSEEELAGALGSGLKPENLVLGNARQLPFPHGHFSAVTCHMAFMLMPQAQEIVNEIVRVLRPGGVFLAVVGAKGYRTAADHFFLERLGHYLALEGKGQLPQLGDPRVRSEEGLAELFAPFRQWKTEPLTLTLEASPLGLLPYFLEIYNVFPLSEGGLGRLREDLLSHLEKEANAAGQLRQDFQMKKIVAFP
jgi:SAM-dependent methyltransferase